MAYIVLRDVLRDKKAKEAWGKPARTVLNGIKVVIVVGYLCGGGQYAKSFPLD